MIKWHLGRNVFIRMKDIFHQEAFTLINKDSSKLRTYSKVKTNIGIEKYLLSNLEIDERTSITKLRLESRPDDRKRAASKHP